MQLPQSAIRMYGIAELLAEIDWQNLDPKDLEWISDQLDSDSFVEVTNDFAQHLMDTNRRP